MLCSHSQFWWENACTLFFLLYVYCAVLVSLSKDCNYTDILLWFVDTASVLPPPTCTCVSSNIHGMNPLGKQQISKRTQQMLRTMIDVSFNIKIKSCNSGRKYNKSNDGVFIIVPVILRVLNWKSTDDWTLHFHVRKWNKMIYSFILHVWCYLA